MSREGDGQRHSIFKRGVIIRESISDHWPISGKNTWRDVTRPSCMMGAQGLNYWDRPASSCLSANLPTHTPTRKYANRLVNIHEHTQMIGTRLEVKQLYFSNLWHCDQCWSSLTYVPPWHKSDIIELELYLWSQRQWRLISIRASLAHRATGGAGVCPSCRSTGPDASSFHCCAHAETHESSARPQLKNLHDETSPKKPDIDLKLRVSSSLFLFSSEAALWWNLKAQTVLFCPPTVTSARTIWPWPTKTFPMERPEGHTETNLLWKITEEMSTVLPNTMDLWC